MGFICIPLSFSVWYVFISPLIFLCASYTTCLWGDRKSCACGDVGKKPSFYCCCCYCKLNFEYKAFLKGGCLFKLKGDKQKYLKLQAVITEIYKIPF